MNTLNIYNSEHTINFVNGPCGSGKTHSLSKYIQSNIDLDSKYIITVPSKLLADQIYEQLKDEGIQNLFKIHSENTEKVTSNILKAIKDSNKHDSGILVITQQAFSRIPLFLSKKSWNLIVDEIPQIDSFFNFSLPYNYSLLSDYINIEDIESQDFYKVKLKSDELLTKEHDDVYKIIKPLIKKLADGHDVYTDKTNWDKIVINNEVTKDSLNPSTYGNSSNMLFFLAIQTPELYLGFKKTIMMGANFTNSLLYKLWNEKYNIQFKNFTQIENGLRYSTHTNGNRLHIKYTQEARASKHSSKKMIDGMTREQKRTEIVDELFKDKPFVFMSNNDSLEDYNLNGIKIPVISHGLNKFDSYHNIYFSPALNRTPKHGRMLELLGVEPAYLTRSSAHEVAYQGILRTSMRNPEAIDDVTVVVVDLSTAESLARLFPGCTIGPVDGVARKTKAMTQQIRDNKGRLKKLQEMLTLNSLSQDPSKVYAYLSQDEKNGYNLKSTTNSLNLIGSSSQNQNAITTFIDDIYSKNYRSYIGSNLEFVSFLRKTYNCSLVSEKNQSKLFNMTRYLNLNDRKNSNIEYSSGVILDMDNGKLTPEEFKQIFEKKGYSFCMMNSFSRSEEKPNNYRVIFFLKYLVTADVYKDIQQHLLDVIKSYGYTKESSGIDQSKTHAGSFFYLPCKVIDREEYAFFWKVNMSSSKQLERCAIDPLKVIESIKDVIIEPRIRYEQITDKEVDIVSLLKKGSYDFTGHRDLGRIAAIMNSYGLSILDFEEVVPFIDRKNRSREKIEILWNKWIRYSMSVGVLFNMIKEQRSNLG